MTLEKTVSHLRDWTHREELAEKILPLTGAIYRERGVVTAIFGVSLVHKDPVDIIRAHRYMRKSTGRELPLEATLEVLETMRGMGLSPARVDIGKMVQKHEKSGSAASLGDFVRTELAELANGKSTLRTEPQDIVLYGFGRIGRLLARILVEKTGNGDKFRLRAIVVRKQSADDLEKRASLLRRDSVHGPFKGSIQVDAEGKALIINGNYVQLIYSDNPETVDYGAYGIHDAIVVDNTGLWRDRETMGRHLKANGVSKVILTAPGKGDIPNIVYGVNHETIDPKERLLSAASCTTNAIVPVLKAIEDHYGIENGHVETVHSYTNDQNLTDNFHKKERRGRSAPLNMVITETGAASAIAKALPGLKGKITGNAIRVPTPNVSLAILVLNLKQETTAEDVNAYLRGISIDSPLQSQIDYTQSPDVASTDMVGNRHAAIVDAKATIAAGKRITLYAWYDNEFGYSCQVVRVLQHVAGILPPAFPKA